ncbi:MAG: XRE family transcriptional regulator [Gammaproteobacteria bacterium]|nr:XRE family transcriptional regulator [Gammaproteobacteria bacterium]
MSSVDSVMKHTTSENNNVFVDLGFEKQEAAKLIIKSQLMIHIRKWIKENNLRQEEAAGILHVNRPRVSDVMTGKVGKFTIDALVDMLECADLRVSVSVK